MNLFTRPYMSLSDIRQLSESLQKKDALYELTGTTESALPGVIHALGEGIPWKILICENETSARALYEELSFFEDNCIYYPAKDILFYQADISSNTLTRERICALHSVYSSESGLVVTTCEALMNRIPGPEMMTESVIKIRDGEDLDLSLLKRDLLKLGYTFETQVSGPGEFASRGGIIDIFPLTEQEPVRIELWDTMVDSIRTFDPGTQKSTGQKDEVRIYLALELSVSEKAMSAGTDRMRREMEKLYETYRKEMKTEEAFRLKSDIGRIIEGLEEGYLPGEAESFITYFSEDTYSILDHLPKDTAVFINEPAHICERMETLEKVFTESMIRRIEKGYALPGQSDMLFSAASIEGRLEGKRGVMLSALGANLPWKPKARYFVRTVPVNAYGGSVELLVKELSAYSKRKMRVILCSQSRTRARRLADDLRELGVRAYYSENADAELAEGDVLLTAAPLRAGFELPEGGYVFIAETDIFGSQVKKKKRRKRYEGGERISSLSDLMTGDYVVHESYGLGVYQGMERIERDHVVRDYIKIGYAKGSNLYVLATQLDAISKYGAMTDKKPKLNTLGGGEWSKTKQRVKEAVTQVAQDLVELYALRKNSNGYVYGEDTVWQKEFEESFPYDETDSQLSAIEDVKADMESTKIMDRLICGDVGYGKTEIAIRAAFKAVQENKQVVYLCPTTILAQQHYNTFTSRMREYPINIGLLSRFRTDAENKATVKELKEGTLDIVIGTHRALSKDVSYKDLGLLIIDEEQRFGVRHKEKIKSLKKDVDVLALSATPIPRTLHMSLVGIRDMSLLEDAPVDRTPIQTFVFEQNEEMVREAIEREMDRGGQIYYVINRVRQIADVAAKVQALVPDARVAYAHGQMNKDQLEHIMSDFVEREIDVLVATTIIEIGLDISNVNTIIIHDADQLGLAQLYQLRGRVGRSNRTAYAFLMYKRDKVLKEVAEKRLSAIREFTDLGSGFKIAMRDLSIRGAGNVLGEAQSGHMEAVGYELYAKLLGEAVAREKGEEVKERVDTTVDIKLDAFLPEDYIPDVETRLSIYKRIAAISSDDEEQEMLDELIDRFGDVKKSVMNLLFVSRLRRRASEAYITEVRQVDGKVSMKMDPNAPVNVSLIPEFVREHSPYIEFVADASAPAFIYNYSVNSRVKEKDVPEKLMELVGEFSSKLLSLQ